MSALVDKGSGLVLVQSLQAGLKERHLVPLDDEIQHGVLGVVDPGGIGSGVQENLEALKVVFNDGMEKETEVTLEAKLEFSLKTAALDQTFFSDISP